MSLTKKYLINGPNNVVRLTDGNKILYIFGDYHMESNYQTQCALDDNYPSIDIDVLLFEFMKLNKEKQFDLFVEDFIFNFKQTNNKTINRDIYIENIANLFTDSLIENKHEIKINPKYPKFRFHNMDIRTKILHNYIILNFKLKYVDINYYIIQLNELKELVKNSFNNTQQNNIIKKLLNKYSNNSIKNKINKLYQLLYVKNFNIILKMINDTKKMLIKSKKIDNFEDIWNNIIKYYIDMNVLLTDLYFIKRFLDKNYINNSILYAGQYHLIDISYILIKYFNFKMTNIFYNPNNIDFNKDFIKSIYSFQYIEKTSYYIENKTNDNKIYQCVNLFDFPENFN